MKIFKWYIFLTYLSHEVVPTEVMFWGGEMENMKKGTKETNKTS